MSLTKFIKAPLKLFRKDIITFLIIRRHDLGDNIEDNLRYIAVKPNASVFVLRQKVWHLLELPDYCEEVIVLKSDDDKQIPLTELRKGNKPHHPYILEVWLPETQSSPLGKRTNLLTLGNGENLANGKTTEKSVEKDKNVNLAGTGNLTAGSLPNHAMPLNSFNYEEKKCINLFNDYKKSNVTCGISTTSIFKLSGRKNRGSFTNILLKIQSDLNTLSNKLSNLETKIPI